MHLTEEAQLSLKCINFYVLSCPVFPWAGYSGIHILSNHLLCTNQHLLSLPLLSPAASIGLLPFSCSSHYKAWLCASYTLHR